MLKEVIESAVTSFKIFEGKFYETPTKEIKIVVIPKKVMYKGKDFFITIYPSEKILEFKEEELKYTFKVKDKSLEIEIDKKGAKSFVEIFDKKGYSVWGEFRRMKDEINKIAEVIGKIELAMGEILEGAKIYNSNVSKALEILKSLNEEKVFVNRSCIGDLFGIEVKRDVIEIEIEGFLRDVVQLSENLMGMFNKLAEDLKSFSFLLSPERKETS